MKIIHNLRRKSNVYITELFKMKFFLFIICFTMLLYQSIDLLNEFMSGKTVTNINYGIIRNTTLPAITICHSDLDFKKVSMLNKNVSILYKIYLNKIENASINDINDMDLYLFGIYLKAMEQFFHSESNIKINNYILENLTPFVNQIKEKILSVKFRFSTAHGDIDNDLIRIDYNHYEMKSLPMESIRIFLYKRIPLVYKCYTLFSHLDSNWNNIYIDFRDVNIMLKIDLNSTPIIPTLPIDIMMHSPNTLPFENYDNVGPGYQFIIGYSQWNIERLGKGYDTDCREYKPKEYTRSDCIFDCYQDIVKYQCQTQNLVGSPMFKRKSYFEQRNLSLSKCTVSEKIKLESIKSCEEKCHKECHFTYYSFTISKFTEINMYQANFRFKHNSMPDLTIRYIPEMPLLTFICNFGGILGMWLGLSFYTIFEHIWKIFNVNIWSRFSFTNNINMSTIKNKYFIRKNQHSRRIK